MATQYDSLSRMKQIHVPVLSLHSPQDEVIPYDLGKRLFDAANEPKMFVELRGDHNGGFVISEDIFKDGVRRFVSTYFGAVRSSQR